MAARRDEQQLAVASDAKLGLIAVGGFAAAVALFALASWLSVALLRRAVPEARAPRWAVLATRTRPRPEPSPVLSVRPCLRRCSALW